jgi:hypothetical protein
LKKNGLTAATPNALEQKRWSKNETRDQSKFFDDFRKEPRAPFAFIDLVLDQTRAGSFVRQ